MKHYTLNGEEIKWALPSLKTLIISLKEGMKRDVYIPNVPVHSSFLSHVSFET